MYKNNLAKVVYICDECQKELKEDWKIVVEKTGKIKDYCWRCMEQHVYKITKS